MVVAGIPKFAVVTTTTTTTTATAWDYDNYYYDDDYCGGDVHITHTVTYYLCVCVFPIPQCQTRRRVCVDACTYQASDPPQTSKKSSKKASATFPTTLEKLRPSEFIKPDLQATNIPSPHRTAPNHRPQVGKDPDKPTQFKYPTYRTTAICTTTTTTAKTSTHRHANKPVYKLLSPPPPPVPAPPPTPPRRCCLLYWTFPFVVVVIIVYTGVTQRPKRPPSLLSPPRPSPSPPAQGFPASTFLNHEFR